VSLILIGSPLFAEHQTPPGHPERPERATVMDAIAREWRARGGEVQAPRVATREQLARVHADDYLRKIEALAGRPAALDSDTYTSPETVEVAALAAGAAIDAVERVLERPPGHRALALVRPPGHHAERSRAMGFCLYNNMAVAAAHARALGVARVAIVDYDVHHGNGTQHIFEADPSVLYVSIHQFPYYPGTGDVAEIGIGEGEGHTVNVALETGATDADYREVFNALVSPVLRQFEPDILLVSAGFDAHERDPLGGMRLTSGAFGAMTQELCAVADECCEGRLVAITEGGYDLTALEESLAAVVDALAGPAGTPARWPETVLRSLRGAEAVRRTKAALSGFWKATG
jgi:acetoin utilization deacetylase AcuC-like enzyme